VWGTTTVPTISHWTSAASTEQRRVVASITRVSTLGKKHSIEFVVSCSTYFPSRVRIEALGPRGAVRGNGRRRLVRSGVAQPLPG
jgi:hypothetical protein